MYKKKFGQHFLRDPSIAKREVRYADITKQDIVLEIGPGYGILTKFLAEQAEQVIAVEIDSNLISHLRRTMPSNVRIIEGDILKIDLNELPSFNKIVSNLPFNISSPITFKLLEYNFDKAILIYQKEFAERMIAKIGDKNYSRLSVMLAYKTRCRILEYISKKSFYPPPKIDVCIVELIPYKTPPFHIEDEVFFSNIVREFFNHRRKKIRYTLKSLFGIINKDIPFQDKRIEELTHIEIADLINILYHKYNDKL